MGTERHRPVPLGLQLNRLHLRDEPTGVIAEERGHHTKHRVTEAADIQDVTPIRRLRRGIGCWSMQTSFGPLLSAVGRQRRRWESNPLGTGLQPAAWPSSSSVKSEVRGQRSEVRPGLTSSRFVAGFSTPFARSRMTSELAGRAGRLASDACRWLPSPTQTAGISL